MVRYGICFDVRTHVHGTEFMSNPYQQFSTILGPESLRFKTILSRQSRCGTSQAASQHFPLGSAASKALGPRGGRGWGVDLGFMVGSDTTGKPK